MTYGWLLPCNAGCGVRSGHISPFKQKFKSLGVSPKSPPYAQCLVLSAPSFSKPYTKIAEGQILKQYHSFAAKYESNMIIRNTNQICPYECSISTLVLL